MPARHDLLGARLGRLVVLSEAPSPTRDTRAWRVRCDCGAEEIYPQRRLTQNRADRPAVRACYRCSAPPCDVCGRPVEDYSRGRRVCADPACALTRAREQSLAYYYRVQRDPIGAARRRAAIEARLARLRAEDPDAIARANAARRARSARAMQDPAMRERKRAQARQWYALHAERVLATRRARLDALSAEQMARWIDRTRAYGRAYRRRWRENLSQDPEAHRAYLDLMAEYRRRRALLRLLAEASTLETANE
jgi:hypothetical protein